MQTDVIRNDIFVCHPRSFSNVYCSLNKMNYNVQTTFSNKFFFLWNEAASIKFHSSRGFNWQCVCIESVNALAPIRQQYITWTDDDLDNWRIFASLRLNESIPGTHYIKWAHNPNLAKIHVIIAYKLWSIQITISHMPRQLSCRGMCKVVTWLDHQK